MVSSRIYFISLAETWGRTINSSPLLVLKNTRKAIDMTAKINGLQKSFSHLFWRPLTTSAINHAHKNLATEIHPQRGQDISHFNFLFLCHLLMIPAAGEEMLPLFKSFIAKDETVQFNVVHFHNDC